jgi:hypothetical protein
MTNNDLKILNELQDQLIDIFDRLRNKEIDTKEAEKSAVEVYKKITELKKRLKQGGKG